MRVLVLEDNDNRIKQFKQRFLERGWYGVFVKNADDAIEAYKLIHFDISFLDHDLGISNCARR